MDENDSLSEYNKILPLTIIRIYIAESKSVMILMSTQGS